MNVIPQESADSTANDRKRFLSVFKMIFTTVYSGFVRGCGQKTQNTQNSQETQEADTGEEPGEEEKTSDAEWDTGKDDTITLSVINNFYTAGEKKLAEEYMKLHPETKVVVDVVSDNDAYKAKMMTSLDGDQIHITAGKSKMRLRMKTCSWY